METYIVPSLKKRPGSGIMVFSFECERTNFALFTDIAKN